MSSGARELLPARPRLRELRLPSHPARRELSEVLCGEPRGRDVPPHQGPGAVGLRSLQQQLRQGTRQFLVALHGQDYMQARLVELLHNIIQAHKHEIDQNRLKSLGVLLCSSRFGRYSGDDAKESWARAERGISRAMAPEDPEMQAWERFLKSKTIQRLKESTRMSKKNELN